MGGGRGGGGGEEGGEGGDGLSLFGLTDSPFPGSQQ